MEAGEFTPDWMRLSNVCHKQSIAWAAPSAVRPAKTHGPYNFATVLSFAERTGELREGCGGHVSPGILIVNSTTSLFQFSFEFGRWGTNGQTNLERTNVLVSNLRNSEDDVGSLVHQSSDIHFHLHSHDFENWQERMSINPDQTETCEV